MLIENLDDTTRQVIYQLHRAMTQAALVQIFDKSEEEAYQLMEGLSSRFANAPQREQDLLLHNDPVALACDLAQRPWESVPQERLDRFNKLREQGLPIWQRIKELGDGIPEEELEKIPVDLATNLDAYLYGS